MAKERDLLSYPREELVLVWIVGSLHQLNDGAVSNIPKLTDKGKVLYNRLSAAGFYWTMTKGDVEKACNGVQAYLNRIPCNELFKE